MSPLLKQLLLPPASLIIAIIAGLILVRLRKKAGWWIASLSALILYALSTPLGSGALSRTLETYPPLSIGELDDGAQAIVIFGSDGVYAGEFGGETVGALTLARLRYGAHLHARTGLPILVSGGPLDRGGASLSLHMSRVLWLDYGISGVWRETTSLNTWENAEKSAAILRAKNIDKVYLVVHARDMARALRAFKKSGVEAIPAPMAFEERRATGLRNLSPSAKSMLTSYYALYEIIGGVEYRLRYP